MRTTGDRRPVEWLCHRVGSYLVESQESAPDELDSECLRQTQAILAEFSNLLQVISESIGNEGRIDEEKVTFRVRKVRGEDGHPVRKEQNFTAHGISVIDARITDMRPNLKFVERMQLKQKATAHRAIARAQRIQEEEQRRLAVAEGEREVTERQASAFAQRAVPTNVFGASGDSGVPVGGDGEAKAFMQMLTLDAAERLSYDRGLEFEKTAGK